MTRELIKKRCRPCEGGERPLTGAEAEDYLKETPGWEISSDREKISREFRLRSFKEAVNFSDAIAELAERENHHPDIHIFYNRVLLELSTHAIHGLSENDFILAAKINHEYSQSQRL